MNIFGLISKALAAFKAGDWSTLADLAGDLLKAAAPLLPKASAPDVLPLSLPGGFDLDKLLTLIQLLKSIFGK